MSRHKELMEGYEKKKPTKEEKAAFLELRLQNLLRNGFKSKSGMTLADTEVLKEIAKRLGYNKKDLLEVV